MAKLKFEKEVKGKYVYYLIPANTHCTIISKKDENNNYNVQFELNENSVILRIPVNEREIEF